MTLRGTTSMSMGACIGLKETLAANRFGGNNHDHYSLSPYFGKNFFEGENYRAALERLDGGKNRIESREIFVSRYHQSFSLSRL